MVSDWPPGRRCRQVPLAQRPGWQGHVAARLGNGRPLRGDLSAEELLFLLGYLLQAAARLAAEHQAGVEKAAALVTSVFLHGTENRKDAELA